ncbi:MAG: desulfoferrodoxin [Lachnospiraceae bacterium]|nr:desulfoferrodoxin [Lachnospiraceae bacterium]
MNKFYICEHCGNIIGMVKDAGVPVVCCGEKVKALIPGSVDAAQEKHVPVVQVNGNEVVVKVGEVTHPMTEEHLIQWIYLETNKGGQIRHLNAQDAPEATFIVGDDKPVAVYEYCNLHGLWKTDL